MKEVCRLLSVKQLVTPYHPNCNGVVEKFNGTLKDYVETHVFWKPKDWDIHWTIVVASPSAIAEPLVYMGRHKCEAVDCVSSQLQCIFFLLNYYIVHFSMANKIWYDIWWSSKYDNAWLARHWNTRTAILNNTLCHTGTAVELLQGWHDVITVPCTSYKSHSSILDWL